MSSNYYFAHFNGSHFSKYVHEYKNLTVFIDYNNNITGTYSETAALNIIAEYKTTSKFTMYKLILQTLMQYLANNPTSDIIIHCESGSSQYHLGLSKEYKSRRGEWLIMTPEDVETFTEINHGLKKLTQEFVAKYVPGVKFVHFHYMEADIVPYLWLEYDENSKSRYHILCSNDKDLTQCLQYKNVIFQYRQSPTIKDPNKRIITGSNILSVMTGDYTIEEEYTNISTHIVPFMLSICGDNVDNVIGIKGIGYKTAFKLIRNAMQKNSILHDMIVSNYSTVNDIKDIYQLIIANVESKYAKKFEDNMSNILLNHQLCDFKIIRTYMQTKYKDQLKEEIARKHSPLSANDFIAFIREIIWDDAEFLHKCKLAYEKILATRGYQIL